MDQRVIEIALQNLLSNALKYSPPEEFVNLDITADDDGWIEFAVRDRGIGIPAEDLFIGAAMSAMCRGPAWGWGW